MFALNGIKYKLMCKILLKGKSFLNRKFDKFVTSSSGCDFNTISFYSTSFTTTTFIKMNEI